NILIEGLKPRVDINKFHDIADKEIIEGRKKHQLDSYVPFHWFSRNPFDGRVQKNFPDEKFVLITIKRALAQKENWKIILRHPLAEANIKIYDYNEGFALINWDIMNLRDYHDPDSKSICMAECLSPTVVEVSKFFKIYVPTPEVSKIVNRELKTLNLNLEIAINEGMFC
ncbi:DarT ssDNA thymidine ADP-ribosyltransferase family protein, partial [Providencia stuartii]